MTKDIWQDRKAALDVAMQGLKDTIAAGTFDRQKTLGDLVICLESFADSHFRFLHDGLIDRKSFAFNQTDEYALQMPAEHVLSITLDQIAFDLDTITRAVHQRKFGSVPMLTTLQTADKLAFQALQRAEPLLINYGVAGETLTTLTYFQDATAATIRVIPYARLALISIPYTCINVPRDLLSIGHEVGHYVFWHTYDSGVLRKCTRTAFKYEDCRPPKLRGPTSAKLTKLLEEIFADVFGCVIAGPVYALSAQDRALRTSAKVFVADDNEHPIPAIRPYIATKALHSEKLAKKLDKWADALEKRWEGRSANLLVAAGVNPSLVTPIGWFDPVLDVMLGKLSALSPQSSDYIWSGSSVVAKNANAITADDLNELYDNFESYVRVTIKPNPVQPPELNVSINATSMKTLPSSAHAAEFSASKLWLDWVARSEFFSTTDKLPPMKDTVIPAGAPLDVSLPNEDPRKNGWIQIAIADSWTILSDNNDWSA